MSYLIKHFACFLPKLSLLRPILLGDPFDFKVKEVKSINVIDQNLHDSLATHVSNQVECLS